MDCEGRHCQGMVKPDRWIRREADTRGHPLSSAPTIGRTRVSGTWPLENDAGARRSCALRNQHSGIAPPRSFQAASRRAR